MRTLFTRFGITLFIQFAVYLHNVFSNVNSPQKLVGAAYAYDYQLHNCMLRFIVHNFWTLEKKCCRIMLSNFSMCHFLGMVKWKPMGWRYLVGRRRCTHLTSGPLYFTLYVTFLSKKGLLWRKTIFQVMDGKWKSRDCKLEWDHTQLCRGNLTWEQWIWSWEFMKNSI